MKISVPPNMRICFCGIENHYTTAKDAQNVKFCQMRKIFVWKIMLYNIKSITLHQFFMVLDLR